MTRRLGAVLIAASGVLGLSRALPADEASEKAAQSAAAEWLALVDSGKYGESWDAASELFQRALTRSQWEEALKKVRTPLGKEISRKVRSAQYTTTIPNAPAGDYVIIQYDTSFEHAKESTETVTPMKEKNGSWRVSGYYIR